MDKRGHVFGLGFIWLWMANVLQIFTALQGLPMQLPRLLLAQAQPCFVHIRGRKFQLIRQIGEGGYAVVHLAREVATPQRPHVDGGDYAIKKLVAASGERLEMTQREIQIHASLTHPNILELLEWDLVGPSGSSRPAPQAPSPARGTPASTMGVPPPGGTCSRMHATTASNSAASGSGFVAVDIAGDQGVQGFSSHSDGGASLGPRPGGVDTSAYLLFPAYPDGTLAEEVDRLHRQGTRLAPQQVLDIFVQICSALQYMHETKCIAHRDLKPHNLLIVRPDPPSPSPSPSHPGHHQHQQAHATSAATRTQPLLQHHPASGLQQESGLEEGTHQSGWSYRTMLMDFGSAGSRHALPASRQDALMLQEEAASHCTATYRAPELFDVPTGQLLDYAKCDVWAAGCSLFHLMYGASPFQKAADQPGGSIALAVLNCSIPWPKEGMPRYPEALHSLVTRCLVLDPAMRPNSSEIACAAAAYLSVVNS